MDRLDLAQMGDAVPGVVGVGRQQGREPSPLCATGSAVVVRRTAGRSSDGAGVFHKTDNVGDFKGWMQHFT